MTKEQLIDLLGDTAAALSEVVRKLRDAQEDMAYDGEAEEEEADEIQNGISTGDVGIGAAVIAAIGAGAGLFINNRRKKK